MSDVTDLKTEVLLLRKENKELRELVKDMVEWAYIDSTCDLQEQFADRMRSLSIEVTA